jgi:hypothetical protein
MAQSIRLAPIYFFILLAVYFVASLIHFAHNAEFLSAYPNLPGWLTRSNIYGAWLAVTAVGALGVVLLRTGRRILGLLFTAVYAALGFAGLEHYWAAPMSAHTLGTNATIWFEVAAAAALLVAVLALLFRSTRTSAAIGDQARHQRRRPARRQRA